MTRQRLICLLDGIKKARICVVGDLFLDKYAFIDNKLDEPSLETGLTAYQAVGGRVSPGAAGTVLSNLCAAGVGKVSVVSMLGEDGDGYEVLKGLRRRGADTGAVIQTEEIITPTYFKPMFLGPDGAAATEGNRLDFKNRSVTPPELTRRMAAMAREAAADADALMILDQLTDADTGVVTSFMREELSRLARENPSLLVFADSRAFIHLFRDVTIKCNNIEAAKMTSGDPEFSEEVVCAAMSSLAERAGRPPFITCNIHGVACMNDGLFTLVPAVRQEGPLDICGAGDACGAGIVAALCAGAGNAEAAFLGNLTAGVTVRKIGETGTASPEEILALYDEQFAR